MSRMLTFHPHKPELAVPGMAPSLPPTKIESSRDQLADKNEKSKNTRHSTANRSHGGAQGQPGDLEARGGLSCRHAARQPRELL